MSSNSKKERTITWGRYTARVSIPSDYLDDNTDTVSIVDIDDLDELKDTDIILRVNNSNDIDK